MAKANSKNVILLLIVLLSPIGLIGKEESFRTQNAITCKVEMADRSSARTFSGQVKSVKTANLAFRVGGPITKINVVLGDLVKKGECLMQIDTRDFYDRLAVLKAQKESIIAQKQNAEKEFERVNSLFQQNIVSQAKFDANHTNLSSLSGSLKAINAQIDIENHQLQDTKLLAPYDCVINSQFAEAHEIIIPGKPVISISDVSHLEVEVNVPENEIVNLPLKKGETAELSFTFSPGKKYDISLKEWCIEAEPVTRTYKIVFKLLPPKDLQILPGMTAEIKWFAAKCSGEEPKLIIPALAIATSQNGKTFVWIYHKETASATKREIEVGSIFKNNSFIVKSGLSEGEEIIAEGADFVSEKTEFSPLKVSLQSE